MPGVRSAKGLTLTLALAGMLACGGDSRRPGNEQPARPADRSAVLEASRPAEGQPTAAEASPPRDAGAISVVISSEDDGALGEFIATLAIADPSGRRTGYDAARGVTLAEIPNAWYDDEVIEDPLVEGSGVATRHLELTSPDPGTYTLSVDATERGRYDLSIRGYNTRLEPSGREFRRVEIGMGETHRYVVEFDPGLGISVTSEVP